jgi:hypothetical protein
VNRLRIAALIIPLAFGGAACSNRMPGPDNPEPRGIVISNAQLSSAAASIAGAQTASAVSEESSFAYVSAEPGTYPDSTRVSIRNLTANSPAKALTVVDGGFDPVAIEARAGNELELTISFSGGATTVMDVRVPSRRPPTVVRTDPAKGRVDVAVNSVSISVGAIFSEPIDPKTLTATSLLLLRDGKPVSGTVRLSENGWTAAYLPDRPLAPLTSYDLVVTRDIRDLDGDALDGSYSSTFTTGNSPCPTVRGGTLNSELLTGCYIGITESFPGLWVLIEQSGTQLTAAYGVVGEQVVGDAQSTLGFNGEFTPSSSPGTFGTAVLRFQNPVNPTPGYFLVIEAEVTRADGSELSGRYFWDDPGMPGGVGEGGPVVLRKL